MIQKHRYAIPIVLISVLVLLQPVLDFAQSSMEAQAQLPAAPVPQTDPAQATTARGATTQDPGSGSFGTQSSVPGTSSGSGVSLSLNNAEALAIKNNPQISVARLTALASQQVTREVRSNLWPTVTGDITGVDTKAGSRITAGALNNPVIYERAAAGVMVSQLITDFGRTSNLISSANYRAKAENENALATKEQILLAVNQAFFNALQAQAVLTVAQQTVQERQTVSNQVGALFKSKLKSELDFSFANVNLAQAQLLLLDAQNNQNATQATLSMVLGFPDPAEFSTCRRNQSDGRAAAKCRRPDCASNVIAARNPLAAISISISKEIPDRGA